jgi:hypothetical protein
MKQWAVSQDNEWSPFDGDVKNQISPGLYELNMIDGSLFMPGRPVLKPMKIASDNLLSLPESLAEYIIRSVEIFWNNKPKYESMGLLHKRGLMLEGAPGTGKTAICLMVGQEFGKKGGIAIFVAPRTPVSPLPEMFKIIRDFHPELPILNILEDIDKHSREIDKLLPMLDGENQIGNIVHLATTNFVDKLDARLTNRPSRFDEVIKAKPPVMATRIAYFETILPKDTPKTVITELATVSKGLGFAHMKELAISVHVYDKNAAKTATRLRALGDNKGTGFVDDEDE